MKFPVGSRALLLGLMLPLGCAGWRTLSLDAIDANPAVRVVTATDIERSGARTAWEALRSTLPGVSLRETRGGTPHSLARHGRASIYLSSAPLVMIDRVPITDVRVLRDLSAGDILSIELLNGIDATTYFGTNAGSGVILIRTKGSEAPPRSSTRGAAFPG